MKYLIMIYFSPSTWESLSEDERNAVFSGHDEFMKHLATTGEMIGTVALADPSQSSTVRVRDGGPAVTDGPFVEAKEYLAGYYLVDCASRERAHELAAMIPDARFSALEVRPLLDTGNQEA